MKYVGSNKYLDLKIYREYLGGLIKTRRLVEGFYVVPAVPDRITNFAFGDKVNRQILMSHNFSDDSPTWRSLQTRTQVKLFGKIRFFLPLFVDHFLMDIGYHNFHEECDQFGVWAYYEYGPGKEET